MMTFLAVLATLEIIMTVFAVVLLVAGAVSDRRHAYDGLQDPRVLDPMRQRIDRCRAAHSLSVEP